MRQLGIAGIKCFDGPCNPWGKIACNGCPMRPMKIYSGNVQGPRLEILRQHGYGMFVSDQYRDVAGRVPYYALDNGAFVSYKTGQLWDDEAFLARTLRYLELDHKPDFVVVPDKVAQGIESLAFSVEWLGQLPPMNGVRRYLAVQDGMEQGDVEAVLGRFGGLFVGGTRRWKYATARTWVELAHRHNKPCHIGRVYQPKFIAWARDIGADSIDSTGWARNGTWVYIEQAGMIRTFSRSSGGPSQEVLHSD